MEETTTSLPPEQEPTIESPKKKGWIISGAIALLAILAGLTYFVFQQPGADEAPPQLGPEQALFQGFLKEDFLITLDEVEQTYLKYEYLAFDEKDKELFETNKAEFESAGIKAIKYPTTAKNKGLRYFYANSDMTMEDILYSISPDAGVFALGTYNAKDGKFQMTPNTYYSKANTSEAVLDKLDEIVIEKGKTFYFASSKSTEAYNVFNGSAWAKTDYDLCGQAADGWYNFAISENTRKDFLSYFEPCINDIQLIWPQSSADPAEFGLEDADGDLQPLYRNTSNGTTSLEVLDAYNPEYSLVWVLKGDGFKKIDINPPTPIVQKPGAPTIVDIKGGDGTLELRWEPAPATGDEIKADSYQVECTNTKTGTVAIRDGIKNTGTVIDKLTNGVEYKCTVHAVDIDGKSGDKSPEISGTPVAGLPATDEQPAPGTPGSPNIKGESSDGTIDLRWEAPTDDGGSPITGYHVVCTTATPDKVVEEKTEKTNITFTGLENGLEYICNVVAINNEGEGLPSEDVKLTPNNDKPGVPKDVAITGTGDGFVRVRWGEPDYPSKSGIASYTVECTNRKTDQVTVMEGVTEKMAEVKGLENGVSYTCTVEAVNNDDVHSDKSPNAEGTPKADETTPGEEVPVAVVPEAITKCQAVKYDSVIRGVPSSYLGGMEAFYLTWDPVSTPENVDSYQVKALGQDENGNLTNYTFPRYILGSAAQRPVDPYYILMPNADGALVFNLDTGTYLFAIAAVNEVGAGNQCFSAGSVVPKSEPVEDPNKDSDGDQLTDIDETNIYGTDPFKFDTDGDGFDDGVEVNNGQNPLIPEYLGICGLYIGEVSDGTLSIWDILFPYAIQDKQVAGGEYRIECTDESGNTKSNTCTSNTPISACIEQLK